MVNKKTVEKHEELNLHIKKRTVNIILRALIGIPIGAYLLVCNFISSKFDWACQTSSCFEWWWIGNVTIMIIVALLIIGLTTVFIAWNENIFD